MKHKHLILGSLFVLMEISEVSSTEMHPSHEAHVHSKAVLNIVFDGSTLFIEFVSPATNLLGFEHTPVNDEQKSVLQNAKQTLATADRLFYFSTTTCRTDNVEVKAPYMNQHEDKKHAHHGEHADFHASYTFKCEQAKDLKEITIKLFALFPGIHEIKTQWIFQGKQGAALLTADSNMLQVN